MDLAAFIVTAVVTVGLALLAYVQIRAGQSQAREQSGTALAIAQEQPAAALTVACETQPSATKFITNRHLAVWNACAGCFLLVDFSTSSRYSCFMLLSRWSNAGRADVRSSSSHLT